MGADSRLVQTNKKATKTPFRPERKTFVAYFRFDFIRSYLRKFYLFFEARALMKIKRFLPFWLKRLFD
jgi:hypothetical protein